MLEVVGIDVFYGDAQALWAVSMTIGDAEVGYSHYQQIASLVITTITNYRALLLI